MRRTLQEELVIDLHSGEEKDGMQRFNAHYIGYNDDDSQIILFENGNQYTINSEGEVIDKCDGEDELFIDRQIISATKAFISKNPKLTHNYDFVVSNYDDCIEFVSTSKDKRKVRGSFLRIVINRGSKSVDISNIMVPFELKHNGFGKGVLREIFKVVQKHNYQLYLVQMVEGFYNRMVKRGAEVIVPLDVVEITENTNLVYGN